MSRRISLVLMSILLVALLGSACAQSPVGSQEQGQQMAEEFVKMEATYRFDGIPETLDLTITTSVARGWKYTIEFDSRYTGYGNRTGKILAQVITHHTAVVTVQSGRVTSAIMDNKWDMIKSQQIG